MHLIKPEYLSKNTQYLPNEIIPAFLDKRHVIQNTDIITFLFADNAYLSAMQTEIRTLQKILELYEKVFSAKESIIHLDNLHEGLYEDELHREYTKEEFLILEKTKLYLSIFDESKFLLDYQSQNNKLFSIKSLITNYQRKLYESKMLNTGGKYPNCNTIFYDNLYECIAKLEEQLQDIIPDFFTCDLYFTNRGFSFFSVDVDTYYYFVGNTRGTFSFQPTHYFINEYDKQIIDSTLSELESLLKAITTFPHNYHILNYLNEKLILAEEIPNDFLIKLIKQGIISINNFDNSNEKKSPFHIKEKYKTLIITFLAKKRKDGKNPPYPLYKELFDNFTGSYKENKQTDSLYWTNNVVPFLKNCNLL